MTAVEQTQAKRMSPESNQEMHLIQKPDRCKLYFTFHLRLAYCLLKFSKLTTDSLFTMACLGFRGCRDTMREEIAEEVSVMLMSKNIILNG